MKELTRSLSSLTALCVLSALAFAGTPSAAAEPRIDTESELWVIRSQDQSWREAFETSASRTPQAQEAALDLIVAWSAREEAGQSVPLPEADDGTSVADQLEALKLEVTTRPVEPGATQTVPVPELEPPGEEQGARRMVPDSEVTEPTGTEITAAATAVDPGDPNTFPVRGFAGSGRLFWRDMPLILEAGVYRSGSFVVTDRYTARVRINPGATSSLVTSSNLYSPNGGHFQNKHFQIFAVCRGRICSSTNTGDLPTASSNVISQYGDRHGLVLTIGVVLWVYFTQYAAYGHDEAKTTDATCEARSTGNACRY